VTTCANLVLQLKAVGLEPPSAEASGTACTRTYRDINSRAYTLEISFHNNTLLNNHIQMTDTGSNGMCYELGIIFDTLIDGERNGAVGDFLYAEDDTTTTYAAWPDATANALDGSIAALKLDF